MFGHFVELTLKGLRDLTINLTFVTSFGDFENVKYLILSITQFVTSLRQCYFPIPVIRTIYSSENYFEITVEVSELEYELIGIL